MKEKKSRRSFLGKLGLAVSGALAFPNKGISTEMMEANTQQSAVKRIKALGFQWQTTDPFLFCVHHEDYYPKGEENFGPKPEMLKGRDIGSDFLIKDGWRMYHGSKVPGFPRHPHRGFETVTVVLKGMVDHSDSLGGKGRYGGGDVQWMTAGSGVQHAEMFPLLHQDKENTLELFQIWLNLPKKDKFAQPSYKMLWREEIPTYTENDASGKCVEVTIIAGELGGQKAPSPAPDSWAADKENDVAIWLITLAPNAKWTIPAASAGLNRTVYFHEGESVSLDGKDIPHYHAAELLSNRNVIVQNGPKESRLLLLQGKPISEPVVQHGPFVMNTKQEIQQAFNDFQQTQFGGWPMNRIDPVHGPYEGRFAYHIDGSKEIKES